MCFFSLFEVCRAVCWFPEYISDAFVPGDKAKMRDKIKRKPNFYFLASSSKGRDLFFDKHFNSFYLYCFILRVGKCGWHAVSLLSNLLDLKDSCK